LPLIAETISVTYNCSTIITNKEPMDYDAQLASGWIVGVKVQGREYVRGNCLRETIQGNFLGGCLGNVQRWETYTYQLSQLR